jgi:hypothetical protein
VRSSSKLDMPSVSDSRLLIAPSPAMPCMHQPQTFPVTPREGVHRDQSFARHGGIDSYLICDSYIIGSHRARRRSSANRGSSNASQKREIQVPTQKAGSLPPYTSTSNRTCLL